MPVRSCGPRLLGCPSCVFVSVLSALSILPDRAHAVEDIGVGVGCSGQPPLEWIPSGTRFSFEDIVSWSGKTPGQRFEEVASRIDTIVVGPHASAAFPEELRAFVSPNLTHRKQFDFSDVSTRPLGREWARLDPHVVFVENPHARVVTDPNRARGEDPELHLREFFARLDSLRDGTANVSFAGVDAVRPVTFSLEDVLLEPDDEAPPHGDRSWASLVDALKTTAQLGPLAYERALDRVVGLVLEARAGKQIQFVGLHDTSNFKMRPDGAIVVERPEKDRLPSIVNFGNVGNSLGDGPTLANTTLASGDQMRRIASAWAHAFGVESQQDIADAISFNHPYAGGHEVQTWSRRFFQHNDADVVTFQVEFERAFVLGPKADEALRHPGSSWPAEDSDHVHRVASQLRVAGDLLRKAAVELV